MAPTDHLGKLPKCSTYSPPTVCNTVTSVLLREALLTFVGAAKLVFPLVSPLVRCPENNWFLPRVYEPTTHASVYWDFEIMILKAPEKNSHKVKLRLKVGTLGDRFLNTFGGSFLKNVAKTCRSRLSCQRPGNDHQLSGRHCDVPANVSWSCLMKWTVSAIRASLPCRVLSSFYPVEWVER